MTAGWINFFVLIFASILFFGFFYMSIQPVERAKRFGEAAWQQCTRFRHIAVLFEAIRVTNLILWIWIPPSIEDRIMPEFGFKIPVLIFLSIPFWGILIMAIKDAGTEAMTPSKETKMFGGIYLTIRHPMLISETVIYILYAFALNSWILFIYTIFFIIIVGFIAFIFEERDLVKRFGESYRQYQLQTGALFPRIK